MVYRRTGKRRDKKDKTLWWANGSIAFILLFFALSSQSPQAKRDRQLTQEMQRQRREFIRQDSASDREQEIASKRYRGGCIMPADAKVDGQGYFYQVTLLTAGQVVVDPATGAPAPDGQIVCDDRGSTFRIVRGVTAEIARSLDTDLINQRFDDAWGWNPDARRSPVVAETIMGNANEK